MDETENIWHNGKLVNWHDAKVHVLTHSLHYGLAVFEGIRFYDTEEGSAIFRLKEHIDRLLRSAEISFMKVPYSQKEIIEAVKETVRANNINEGYIRPIIFYGYGKMGLNPDGAPVDIAIAVWPWGSYLGQDAVKIKTSSYIRIHPKTTHADAKITGHYVNSIFASVEAKRAGYDEALLLDYQGNVSEGAGENIFMIKNHKIYTPPLGNILPGITRMSIIELARDETYQVEERILNLSDMKNADEVFLTGTAAEVTPVKQIDDKSIGTGKTGIITSELREKFLDIVHGRNNKYEKWISYVNM